MKLTNPQHLRSSGILRSVISS